jgi:hypothetical protein
VSKRTPAKPGKTRRGKVPDTSATARRVRAAQLSASGMQASDVVAAMGAHRSTFSEWSRHPDFQKEYERVVRESRDRVIRKLTQSAEHAAQRIIDLVDDEDPQVALKASQVVLARSGVSLWEQQKTTVERDTDEGMITRVELPMGARR